MFFRPSGAEVDGDWLVSHGLRRGLKSFAPPGLFHHKQIPRAEQNVGPRNDAAMVIRRARARAADRNTSGLRYALRYPSATPVADIKNQHLRQPRTRIRKKGRRVAEQLCTTR